VPIARKEKKKKKDFSQTRGFSGGSSVQTSELRPVFVPKAAPCMTGCPQGQEIRKFMVSLAQGEDYGRSPEETVTAVWEALTERNPFPAVCGRVCPHPCESECNRKEKEGPVSINDLEQFLGDWGLEHGLKLKKADEQTRAEKIAVVGAGPAGLTFAYHLARRGYPVTVFEAFSKPGGMLRYGIPSYRLPESILDAEIRNILDLGIDLKCNTVVGKDVSYDELKSEYAAIFVALGAHKGMKLGLEHEDAPNVWTGTEFLNKVNSGEPPEVGDHVVAIGGGDTAIDTVRLARRLGAKATILYRRSRTEMPAIDEEIEGAEFEGVEFHFLAAPIGVLMADGKASGLRCQRMELGEPDASGRRRPVPVEGSEFDVPCSTIVAAISQEPDFTGLELLREGRDWVKTDDSGKTELEKTWAGGDVINLWLVTGAIFHGRRAAEALHETLRGIESSKPVDPTVVRADKLLLSHYEEKARQEAPELTVEERLATLDAEIRQTLTLDQALAEAKRCMSCGYCFDCGNCWSYCQDNAVVKPLTKGQPYSFKLDFCNGCKKCAEQCPCGYIEMFLPGTGPKSVTEFRPVVGV